MGTLRRRKGRKIWTATFRDCDGIRREVTTGCQTKDAARQVLAELERSAEKVRAGIVSRQEARSMECAGMLLSEHIESHVEYLSCMGRAASTIRDQRRLMFAVVNGCGWVRLGDLSRSALERWLTLKVSNGMSARTRNAHAAAALMFANWMVKAGRMVVNPFVGLPMMNVNTDRRHERRVLTMSEFARLLHATERRPLESASENRGAKARLKASTMDRLQWLGRTRKMVYATLMFTGLRYGELRSITIGQLHIDSAVPYIELRACDEKARRGAQVPVPASLAALLSEYLFERRSRLLGQRSPSRSDIVAGLSNVVDKAPLFDMPANMMHAFNADIRAAGIPKKDVQGRVLDIHALRHSFCTMVAQSGVSMQQAQRLMRHATPQMTAKYTHLTLADLSNAIIGLPALPELSEARIIARAKDASILRPQLRPHIECNRSGLCAVSCTIETRDAKAGDVREEDEDPSVSGVFKGIKTGSGGRGRTADKRIMIPLLYQLSYAATALIVANARWRCPT